MALFGFEKFDVKRIAAAVRWVEQQRGQGLAFRRRRPPISTLPGRVRWAKTQEASPAAAKIKVKLLSAAGLETGSEFDAWCVFTDGSTKANECTPNVQNGSTVLIVKQGGYWFILTPTFTEKYAYTKTEIDNGWLIKTCTDVTNCDGVGFECSDLSSCCSQILACLAC